MSFATDQVTSAHRPMTYTTKAAAALLAAGDTTRPRMTLPKGPYLLRNLRIVADTLCEGPSVALYDPAQAVQYMAGAWDQFPEQEQSWVILLNSKNKPIGRQLITVGTINQTLVSPREVFRAAIIGGATAVILLHNHPSGDPSPSAADTRITQKIRAASEVLDIYFHDHIVVGNAAACPVGLGYYSFRSAGML